MPGGLVRYRDLADALEHDPLFGEIRARRPLPGGFPEFVYRPRGTTQDIRFSRASSMVTELAPIVLFLRGIVHRTASSFLLGYVDHHDAAYQWAERRRLERHPTTGAAQLVEIRETVREIRVPRKPSSEPSSLAMRSRRSSRSR